MSGLFTTGIRKRQKLEDGKKKEAATILQKWGKLWNSQKRW
jgi:hypothetical protein